MERKLPAETKDGTRPIHYDFLEGLRGLLALYVVAVHCCLTVKDLPGTSVYPVFNVFCLGTYAVCFFIVVSGYCLMLPVLRNEMRLTSSVGEFLKRRALRILPPYYFAMGLTLVFIFTLVSKKTGTHWDLSLPVNARNILSHLALVQNFHPNHIAKINHVFWSISVEWQIYFVFPVLLYFWRRMGAAYLVVAALLGSALLEAAIFRFTHSEPHLHFIGLFTLGMAAAWLGHRTGTRALPWKRLATAAAVVVLIVAHCPFHPMVLDMVFGVFAAIMMVIVSSHPEGLLHRFLSYKPLVFVGTFSYSLYLTHGPIAQILWQYPFASLHSRPNLLVVILIASGLVLSTALAYGFYLVCERPFLRKKKTKAAPTPTRDWDAAWNPLRRAKAALGEVFAPYDIVLEKFCKNLLQRLGRVA